MNEVQVGARTGETAQIERVRTTVLSAEFDAPIADATRVVTRRDVLLVEVNASGGLVGVGFVTGMGGGGGTEIHIIDEIIRRCLTEVVVGKDLFRVEYLWQAMFKATYRFGRKGAALRAISAVDIALWDAIARAFGLPLWRLLGGAREEVPVYASGGLYAAQDPFQGLLEEMEGYVRCGFRAVKMKVGRAAPRVDVERVRRVREAIGPDIDLMLDASSAWTVDEALRMVAAFEEFNVAWLEEPVPADDLEGYARVALSTRIPIAGGEYEYTRWGFRDLILRGRASVLQADVSRVGGVTEWLKVASLASAFNLRMAPHAVQEIHIHMCGAVPSGWIVEYFVPDHPFQRLLTALFDYPGAPQPEANGRIRLPDTPGLGLHVNRAAVEKYRVSA